MDFGNNWKQTFFGMVLDRAETTRRNANKAALFSPCRACWIGFLNRGSRFNSWSGYHFRFNGLQSKQTPKKSARLIFGNGLDTQSPVPSIPSKFPVSVKTGAVVVKIYRVRTGPNGEYVAFNVTFNEGGRRVHRKFSDWPDAKNEAQRIAVSLANRDSEAAQVTYRDAQILAHCRMLLEPFGMTLESAVERFCKAAKAIGPDRVVEAAVSQARAYPVSAPEQIAIADACDIYHGHLVAQGRSKRHLMDVKSRLGRFLTDHQGMNLDDITPAGLQRWIDNLRTVEGKPAAPITRRNSAVVVSAMLSFHRRRGRLAVSPANDLKKPSPRSDKRAEK